jgi:hypothetical protein
VDVLDFMRVLLSVDASQEETTFDNVRLLLSTSGSMASTPHFLTINEASKRARIRGEGMDAPSIRGQQLTEHVGGS